MTSTNLEFTEKLVGGTSGELISGVGYGTKRETASEPGLRENAVLVMKHQLQRLLIASLRPYISAELPGWNTLYRVAIGSQTRDGFWSNAQARFSRNKLHPFSMRFHLSHWLDREAFFLRRWNDLATSVFLRDIVRQGDTIVDIGSSRGMFTLLAAYLTGSSGKVISFEPNPFSRGLLERELAGNRIRHVKVVAKGAAAAPARKTLSISRIDRQAATFGAIQDTNALYHHVETEVVPADFELTHETPSVIKISTEGYETEALRGLSETIKRCHPVLITELSESRLSASGSSAGEFVKLVADLGYLGFKISLSETSETAGWSLRPLSPKDSEIKAIWVHANSPADARGQIMDRLIAG